MNSAADEVVLQLGEALVLDSGVPEDWNLIVSVFKVEPGVVGGWTKYATDEGNLKNIWLEDGEVAPLVGRLHALTKVEGKSPWVACKLTIERDGMKMNIQFEYTDPKRWDAPLPF